MLPRRPAVTTVSRVYDIGAGPALLVMANPQGMVAGPTAHSQLVELLVGLGRRVITFDPPGAFASPRPPRLGLDEMLGCTQEALGVAGVRPPVDVVGHSQATLCQFALALAYPDLVGSLVLVGAVAGGWRTTRRPSRASRRGLCWFCLGSKSSKPAWVSLASRRPGRHRHGGRLRLGPARLQRSATRPARYCHD